jgi:hypothetical protein
MTCDLCETLWKTYEDSVFEHVRLGSRHKLAQASGEPAAIERLGEEVAVAEKKRFTARQALLEHERLSGHGAR